MIVHPPAREEKWKKVTSMFTAYSDFCYRLVEPQMYPLTAIYGIWYPTTNSNIYQLMQNLQLLAAIHKIDETVYSLCENADNSAIQQDTSTCKCIKVDK